MKRLYSFLFIILFSTPCFAQTFTPNSFIDENDANPGDGICLTASGVCTLRAAVTEANALSGAHEIDLAPGTYYLTLYPGTREDKNFGGDLDIETELYIHGNTKPGATIIDGQALGERVLDDVSPDKLTLHALTIQNGNAQYTGSESGGGLQSVANHLEISNVIFKDNQSGDKGGALYHYHLSTPANLVQISNSQFYNNQAARRGSAIYVEHVNWHSTGNGNVELNNNAITNNTVYTNAYPTTDVSAAVGLVTTNATLIQNTIKNNQSTITMNVQHINGVGAQILAKDVELIDNQITHNILNALNTIDDARGIGCLITGAQNIILNHNHISFNQINGNQNTIRRVQGVGLGLLASLQATIIQSNIIENEIHDAVSDYVFGVGVGVQSISPGIFKVQDSLISNNTLDSTVTDLNGIGLSVLSVADFELKSSKISNNLSVYSEETDLIPFNTQRGAGLYLNNVVEGTTVLMTESTLTNNEFNQNGLGAGAYISNHGETQILNSTIAENKIYNSGKGGGLYLYTGYYDSNSIYLGNNTITQNFAIDEGGGLFFQTALHGILLANNIIAGNQSPLGSDCSNSVVTILSVLSLDYNLIGNTDHCQIQTAPNDITGSRSLGTTRSASLRAPIAFDATTTYYPPMSYSPVIDGGNPAGCTTASGSMIKYDQRGMSYYRHQGSACDMGAFESGSWTGGTSF